MPILQTRELQHRPCERQNWELSRLVLAPSLGPLSPPARSRGTRGLGQFPGCRCAWSFKHFRQFSPGLVPRCWVVLSLRACAGYSGASRLDSLGALASHCCRKTAKLRAARHGAGPGWVPASAGATTQAQLLAGQWMDKGWACPATGVEGRPCPGEIRAPTSCPGPAGVGDPWPLTSVASTAL